MWFQVTTRVLNFLEIVRMLRCRTFHSVFIYHVRRQALGQHHANYRLLVTQNRGTRTCHFAYYVWTMRTNWGAMLS